MNSADTLMVIYYVVLSGVLVFALGYLAGWHHAPRGDILGPQEPWQRISSQVADEG